MNRQLLNDLAEHHWFELVAAVNGLSPDEQAEACRELRYRLGELTARKRSGLLFIPEARKAKTAEPTWDEFLAVWNAERGVRHVRASTPERLQWFRSCCRQADFREHWPEAVERAPMCAVESADRVWIPELTWFLKRGGWVKALEATGQRARSRNERRIDTQQTMLQSWAERRTGTDAVGKIAHDSGREQTVDGAIE